MYLWILLHEYVQVNKNYWPLLRNIVTHTPYYEQQTGTLANDQTYAVFVTIILSSSSPSSSSFHYNSHTSYGQLYSSYGQINRQGQLSSVLNF